MDALMTQLNVFATGGSGWVLKTLSRIEIQPVCCNSVTGSSYIETPAVLKPWERFLNVVNKRHFFLVLYSGSPVLHWQAFSSQQPQKNIEKLCFNPKLMPMPLSAIPSFEKRKHCSFNVYQLENTTIVTVYHSKKPKGQVQNWSTTPSGKQRQSLLPD